MIISEKLKKENIAEYILYMFHIEDIIRSYKFDADKIVVALVDKVITDKELKKKYYVWYLNLCNQMKEENLIEKGHFSFLQEKIIELEFLHQQLITQNNNYKILVENHNPIVKEYQQKSNTKKLEFIATLFHILYSKILLKHKKISITDASEKFFSKTQEIIILLIKKYHNIYKNL